MAAVQGIFKAFTVSGPTFKAVTLVATFAVLLAGLKTCTPSAQPASILSSAPGHLTAHHLAFVHTSPSLAHHQHLHHQEARFPARHAFSAPVPAWMAVNTPNPTACLLAAAVTIAALLYAASAPSHVGAPCDAAPPAPHPAPPHAVPQSLKRARSLSPAGSPTTQQQQPQRVRPDQRRLAAWLTSAVESQQAALQRCVELQCRRLAAMRQDLDARKARDQGRRTATGGCC